MEARFVSTHPEQIEFTLTLTLPLAQWKELSAAFKNECRYHVAPVELLHYAIRDLVTQAEQHFVPNPKGMEEAAKQNPLGLVWERVCAESPRMCCRCRLTIPPNTTFYSNAADEICCEVCHAKLTMRPPWILVLANTSTACSQCKGTIPLGAYHAYSGQHGIVCLTCYAKRTDK